MKYFATTKSGFVEGTKVYTREGYKPIDSLQVGDEVLTHENRFKKIIKVEILMNRIIWKITTLNDKILKTMDEMLFFTSQIEEIHYTSPSIKKVEELSLDDYLISPMNKLGNEDSNYSRTKITSINNTHTFGTIYRIEVEDDHSYMVDKFFVHD